MNKKRYLIALDLDGTLLRDDKTISETTKSYLRELENEGHLIVLCSGRALRSVMSYYNDVGLKTSPIICYNGHYASDRYKNSFKIEYKINKNTAKSIYFDVIHKYCDSAMSENLHKIYLDKDDDLLFAFYNIDDLKVIYGPLSEIIDEDVFTFLMKIDEDQNKHKKIKEIIENKYKDVQVRFWHGGEYCELYLNGVSKSKMIKEVADKYHIELENIITFGDADNDREMLGDYKNTFVMKNGAPHLRKIAKFVTKYTNEEDGIIYALKEFLAQN